MLQIKQAVSLPVVALGGINKDNAAEALMAGADSVAVISAVLSADDVEKASRQIVERLEDAQIKPGPNR
jgi:thiamine monophosphate synthase